MKGPPSTPPPAATPSFAPPTPARVALRFAAAVAGLLVIGGIDDLTGPYLSFAVFYLGPVLALAYYGGRAPGLVGSVLAAAIWTVADVLDREYPSLAFPLWNGFTRLVIFAAMAALVAELRARESHERRLAHTDGLTSLQNRRAFTAALAALAAGRREARSLTLVYIDVDGFKGVNDTQGHPSGDALLVAIARAIEASIRGSDVAARLGGDEFAIALPGVDEAGAAPVLERLRAKLDAAAREGDWPVGFSLGVVGYAEAPRDVGAMLAAADHRMYAIKRERRTSRASFPGEAVAQSALTGR